MTTKITYYGEASHVYNRLSKHKRLLKANESDNTALQKGYNLYGLNAFKFKVILCGNQWASLTKPLRKEHVLI